jgi:hypothetical protein
VSQPSGDRPNTFDNLKAISGLIPALPFNSAEKVFLVTPSALAASVTLIWSGSTQNSLMISPGWGGLCMAIFSLMIVFIIEIKGIAVFHPEGHSPVSADFDRPGFLYDPL